MKSSLKDYYQCVWQPRRFTAWTLSSFNCNTKEDKPMMYANDLLVGYLRSETHVPADDQQVRIYRNWNPPLLGNLPEDFLRIWPQQLNSVKVLYYFVQKLLTNNYNFWWMKNVLQKWCVKFSDLLFWVFLPFWLVHIISPEIYIKLTFLATFWWLYFKVDISHS